MDCHYGYQQCPGRDRLRPFGAVFAMGVFQSAASFREIQRPEFALRHFIRFAGAKVAVGYSLEIMLAIFHICGGVVSSVMSGMGGRSTAATLPTEIVSAIEDVGFLASIPFGWYRCWAA